MGRITLEQAAQWCGGQIDPKYKDITFFGANNDTRKLSSGELFVALKGVRDGHDFIPAAMEKGAITREEIEVCVKRVLELILKID